jgi:acyl carrier protein
MADYTDTIKNFIENEMIGQKTGTIILNSDSLIEMGIVDSLGVQLLISYLEREFSINVLDNEIIPENFETIKSIANFVTIKLR